MEQATVWTQPKVPKKSPNDLSCCPPIGAVSTRYLCARWAWKSWWKQRPNKICSVHRRSQFQLCCQGASICPFRDRMVYEVDMKLIGASQLQWKTGSQILRYSLVDYTLLLEFNDSCLAFGRSEVGQQMNKDSLRWSTGTTCTSLPYTSAYLHNILISKLISIQMHTENQRIEHIQSKILIIIMVIIHVLLLACQKQKPSQGCSQAKPVPLAPSRLSQPVRLPRGVPIAKNKCFWWTGTDKRFSEAPVEFGHIAGKIVV